MTASRIDWAVLLGQAANIVEGYDTEVTLRQLFYRLVAAELLPNTTGAYKQLSSRTADARRASEFPHLVDRTRSIERYQTFRGVDQARSWLGRIYRRDRTEGQDTSLYVAVEKAGIINQLQAWFGDLGVPILAVRGYSSQSFVHEVAADVHDQDRDAVLIYAGDFDPSGEDILRDFDQRTACFDKVIRVALNAEQVAEYDLPPQMGKAADSRASEFIRRHGALVQVELDALPPDVLRMLYQQAIDEFWDVSAYAAVLASEQSERDELTGGTR